MGYANFAKKSTAQLAKHIRAVAQDSIRVRLTHHAKVQMKARKVAALEIHECLKLGTIRRQPESNEEKGSLECRMERYVSGRDITALVALCDEDPNLVVVTVFEIG
jgi:hypothetical protein